jgi:SAM-dependent methyltransferase
LAEVALPAGADVLDVGCGVGATVALLSDEHGLHSIGLDVSAERVREAAEARPDLRFIVGQAEALPFPSAAFDAVICECVLSTLPVPGLALGEMARVLRPDGVAFISDVYVRTGDEVGSRRVPVLPRRETFEGLLGTAGLRATLWRDESVALGRYLWDSAEVGSSRTPAPAGRSTPAGCRLGYFVCAARPVPILTQGAWRG